MTLGVLCAITTIAHAETRESDGYCEWVEGVARSASDLLYAPALFGMFGYGNEPSLTTATGDVINQGFRVQAGLSYKLSGIYEGSVMRDRAHYDCMRHRALDRMQGETTHRALAARIKTLDAAIPEADKILAQIEADVEGRRATAQDLIATRLRVYELRDLAAQAHRALDALPAPVAGATPLGGALAKYYAADEKIEQAEGTLRKMQAIDVSVRLGYDKFLDRSNGTPVFALVFVSFNLGGLWQGDANQRALIGRRKMVREQDQLVDRTVKRLRELIDWEIRRARDTAALIADLETQMATLDRVGGDDTQRFRQTVWFEYVKVKAEHDYLVAHITSLKELIGGVSE